MEAGEISDFKSVFTRWETFADDLGSSVNFTSKVELIQGNDTEIFAISGCKSDIAGAYTGVYAIPDPSTLGVMRKAKSFSLTVLGDGNTYEVKIPTAEARMNADYNHYMKKFTAKNGVISTFLFSIDDLAPNPNFKKTVPFVHSSIEAFLIQVDSKCDFNLKFWDIRFF